MISPVFLFISGFASPFVKLTPKSISLEFTVVLIPENPVSIDPVNGEMLLPEDSKDNNLLLLLTLSMSVWSFVFPKYSDLSWKYFNTLV